MTAFFSPRHKFLINTPRIAIICLGIPFAFLVVFCHELISLPRRVYEQLWPHIKAEWREAGHE